MPEKEEIIKEFNEGGVKGVMATPTDSALSKLIGAIPTKKEEAKVEATTPENKEVTNTIDTTVDDFETPDKSEIVTTEPKKEVKETTVVVEEPKKETTTTVTSEEGSIIEEFKSEFGDVTGEYDEDTEGLKNYFKKVTEDVIVPNAKKAAIEELFQEAPIVGELAKHIAQGYGIESFQKKFEAFDYSKLEIKEDDKDLQERLYRAGLKAKGNEDSDIEDLIESAKDNGKLLEKAKAATSYLDSLQQADIEKTQKLEKAESDRIAKEEKETIEEINKITKSGKIAGLSFTPERMDSLRKFGTTRDKDGNTERDRKWNSLNLEQLLLLDLIVQNDFKDLGAKVTAATQKAKSLVDIKKKAEGTGKIDLTTSSSGDETKTGLKGDIKSYLQN